jgi:hypothetical protein
MEARSKDVVRRFQDESRSWRFKVEAFVAGGRPGDVNIRPLQVQDFIVHYKYFLAAILLDYTLAATIRSLLYH